MLSKSAKETQSFRNKKFRNNDIIRNHDRKRDDEYKTSIFEIDRFILSILAWACSNLYKVLLCCTRSPLLVLSFADENISILWCYNVPQIFTRDVKYYLSESIFTKPSEIDFLIWRWAWFSRKKACLCVVHDLSERRMTH